MLRTSASAATGCRLHVPPVRSSLFWYIWLTQEAKLVKSAHVTFQLEGKLLVIVGELEAVELSDDEEESTDRENDNGNFERQPLEHQTKSKRSSTDGGLRRSKRLAQRRRASNAQQKSESSDESVSHNDYLTRKRKRRRVLHDSVGEGDRQHMKYDKEKASPAEGDKIKTTKDKNENAASDNKDSASKSNGVSGAKDDSVDAASEPIWSEEDSNETRC